MCRDERCEVTWIDTQLMLADCLTKKDSERLYLLQRIGENTWNRDPTVASLMAKERMRESLKLRQLARKSAKSTDNSYQPLSTTPSGPGT